MAKYRESNKLTQEQRVEIAHLVNSGVPFRDLANGYGVSVNNVHNISGQKSKLLLLEMIAETPETKFLYAQRVYGTDRLTDEGRSYIDQSVFHQIAEKVSKDVPDPDAPLKSLLSMVFDGKPKELERKRF